MIAWTVYTKISPLDLGLSSDAEPRWARYGTDGQQITWFEWLFTNRAPFWNIPGPERKLLTWTEPK